MERRVATPTQRPRTVPGKAIQSLLLEMDAIRQETISSGDIKYSPKSGIGKDVSIIIGRIEKGGLTRPSTSGAQVGIVRETPQPLLSSAHVSNNKNDPERRKKMERSGRSRPAPKSPKSSRPTEPFRKSPLGEIGSTASAKSFKELTSSKRHPDSRSPIPLRPSSSYFYSSTLEGSGSKGSGGKSKAKVKSTRSTIGTLRREMGEAGGDATATAAVVAADGDKSSPALTLKEQFAAFSCFGDKSSDGKSISLTNCDKWMKQAKVIDGKKITTTDTSILFKKLFKTAKKVGFEDFKKYVEELATSKKIEGSELTGKLVNCGPPGLSSATRAAHTGVIERLTDTKKYTGSHKERFDATGKGRGIEGRREAGKSPAAVVRPKPAVAAAAENNGSPSPSPVPPAKE